MPTKRRKRRPRWHGYQDLSTLEGDLDYALRNGSTFFAEYSFDEMKAAWAIHGETLLAEFRDRRPGYRPFGWWLIEGVPRYGERPIIDPKMTREMLEKHAKQNGIRWGILHTHIIPPLQEDEPPFLHRVGALTAEEWAVAGPAYAKSQELWKHSFKRGDGPWFPPSPT